MGKVNYTARAVRNTLIVIAFNLCGAVLGYLVRLLFARNLTPAEFGLFYAVYAFIGLFSLFRTLGLNEALVKYIAHFEVQRKFAMITAVIGRVLQIQMLSSLGFAVALWALSDWLSQTYFHSAQAALVLRLLLISFVLMVFGDTAKFIFQGFQQMVLSASVNPTKMLIVSVVGWLLLAQGLGVVGAAWAYVAVYLLLPFLYAIPLLRRIALHRVRARLPAGMTGKLLRFGIPVTISTMGYMIIEYTDVLILTYFSDLTTVGLYNVAIPTSKLLFYFSGALGIVVFPMVAELWARKLRGKLVEGMERLYTYAMAILVPMGLVVFAFPEIIIRVLFGEQYLAASAALQVLTLGAIAFAIFSLNSSVFAGIGKPNITSRILVLGAAYNIAACIALIPRYGILGAAFATASAYALLLLLSARYTWKLTRIRFPWGKLLQITIAGAAFLGTLAALKHVLRANPFAELAISALLASAVYGTLLLVMRTVRIREAWEVLRTAVLRR